MIEIKHKVMNLNSYKKVEDIERDLDNLASNGFIFREVVGKKNHLLILQKAVEYPDPQQYYQPPQQFQPPELLPPSQSKSRKGKKTARFPNAVYK
jgi:hypothetical protein